MSSNYETLSVDMGHGRKRGFTYCPRQGQMLSAFENKVTSASMLFEKLRRCAGKKLRGLRQMPHKYFIFSICLVKNIVKNFIEVI